MFQFKIKSFLIKSQMKRFYASSCAINKKNVLFHENFTIGNLINVNEFVTESSKPSTACRFTLKPLANIFLLFKIYLEVKRRSDR